MRTIGFLGLLAGALAFSPRHLDATPVDSIVVVKGRVIDDLAAPLDNALVEVTSSTDGRTFSARTNNRGEYTIREVDTGDHLSVLVRRIGFRPARFAVSRSGVDDSIVANVQLLPVPPVVIL